MTVATLLRRPSAFAPLSISAGALAFVLIWAAAFGVARSPDEGAPARVFQLLMLVQVAVMAFFAVGWFPRAPKAALLVLALQLGAAAVPIVVVLILESASAAGAIP